MAAQSAVTGGPNVYSLANSVADFGGMLAPGFKTPRVLHMSGGIQHQIGERGMFSADYVREIGTQFPLGIDTNHVGDASYLTDGDNSNPLLNNYAAELWAINATVAAAGCGPATSTGGEFADGRELLSERCTHRKHHRFRAPRTGFIERVLRTVSVFGVGQATGGVWRGESSGGIERHVLSGRAIEIYRREPGLPRDQRSEPAAAGAAAGSAAAYTLSKYKSNLAEPNGSRRRLFVDEPGGRFPPAALVLGSGGDGPDPPVHLYSDGGLVPRGEAFDDRLTWRRRCR